MRCHPVGACSTGSRCLLHAGEAEDLHANTWRDVVAYRYTFGKRLQGGDPGAAALLREIVDAAIGADSLRAENAWLRQRLIDCVPMLEEQRKALKGLGCSYEGVDDMLEDIASLAAPQPGSESQKKGDGER